MKYELIITEQYPTITIDKSVKEDIKKLICWTEEEFEARTIKIEENKK